MENCNSSLANQFQNHLSENKTETGSFKNFSSWMEMNMKLDYSTARSFLYS